MPLILLNKLSVGDERVELFLSECISSYSTGQKSGNRCVNVHTFLEYFHRVSGVTVKASGAQSSDNRIKPWHVQF